MGSLLGSNLEGSWDEVTNRHSSAKAPFMVMFNEVGYYTVDGMALMSAQSTSIGFSLIYASQSIQAMKRCNAKEALSIIANTGNKIILRSDDSETCAIPQECGFEQGAKITYQIPRLQTGSGYVIRHGVATETRLFIPDTILPKYPNGFANISQRISLQWDTPSESDQNQEIFK